MKFKKLKIQNAYIIKPNLIKDKRGFFSELYNLKSLQKIIKGHFKQENISLSLKKNTFRGFHFQIGKYSQSKLLSVVCGEIDDFILDLRKSSKTYGKTIKINLSENSKKLLFIPKGCAHGFLTKKNNTIINYKVDEYYNKKSDSGINLLGSGIIFKNKLIISKKDKKLPKLNLTKQYFK